MTPDVAPLYRDWHFWSALAAWAALAISLRKPVYAFFQGPALWLEPQAFGFLSEAYGLPRFGLTILLTNVGGMPLRVRATRAEIWREGVQPFVLPGGWYFKDAGDQHGILLSPFRLIPEESWMGAVNFFQTPSRIDERNVRGWLASLHADITLKRRGLPKDAPDVDGDARFWRPLLEYYNSKFQWEPGEYHLRLYVDVEPSKANLALRYRFTVFEGDTEELRKTESDIRHGFFTELSDKRRRAMVPVNLSPE